MDASQLPKIAVFLFLAAAVLTSGCQPAAAPPAGVNTTTAPPAPPPPPGGPAGDATPAAGLVEKSAADTPAVPSAESKAESGLPADLIKKIDTLIQSHKDYIALAEQIQDVEAYKGHRDEISELVQRGSDAYDDVTIGAGKLPPEQKAALEAYMNEHVSPSNNLRRQHYNRIARLLGQIP